MSAPTLAHRLKAGETLLCGWTQLADPLAAEAIAASGFPAVNIDCQHGYAGYEAMKASLFGVLAGGAAPIVRIPHGDFAFAARALDLGAEAVIAPMINSASDAKRYVEAAKYPPLGERSWGPSRMMHVWGMDKDQWLAAANGLQLTLAMIETRAAVDAVDEIAAVEGIDGLFIGPADMSVSASGGAAMDPENSSVLATMDAVADACKRHGKFATGYAQSPKLADEYRKRGYCLIACGSDYRFICAGATATLQQYGD